MSPLNARMYIHEPQLPPFRRELCNLIRDPLEVQKQFNRRVHCGWYAGLRFAKNALNASFASSDLTRSANTWFSNFTACSSWSRNAPFMSRLHACTALAGFSARVCTVSVPNLSLQLDCTD